MPVISIVIPALNERQNIARVIDGIPTEALKRGGWETQTLIVDNGSVDGTGELARSLGATVIVQPVRGYGNAYKAGFANSTGDLIATGDADLTYPFDALPTLLEKFRDTGADFASTDRLAPSNRGAMKPSHTWGNRALSLVSRNLFRNTFRDSQSGMWIFWRYVWEQIEVHSGGMAFSQELKNETHRVGFRCVEFPIEYRLRGGEVKLKAFSDGVRNLSYLFAHRLRPVTRISDLNCLRSTGFGLVENNSGDATQPVSNASVA